MTFSLHGRTGYRDPALYKEVAHCAKGRAGDVMYFHFVQVFSLTWALKAKLLW